MIVNVFQESKMIVLPDNVFLFWNFTYNTQETNLFDIAAFCNNKQPEVKNMTNVYICRLHRRSSGPLRKHGLSSEGSKAHVCRL